VNIQNLAPYASVSITYYRTVNAVGVGLGETSVVTNTAKLSGDSTKSDTAQVVIQNAEASFSVTKKVFDGKDPNGYLDEITIEVPEGKERSAYYRITIRNTGDSPGDVSITDSLGSPNNGGSLGEILTDQFSNCHVLATCSGSLAQGTAQVTNLHPGKSATILYKRHATSDGIPSGGQSQIIDTITLSSGASDSAKVNILSPVTASPSCSLSASPDSIVSGESSNLSWTTQNATSAQINQGIGNVAIPSGILKIFPNVTTTYTMTVTGAGGKTGSCSKTLNVTPLSQEFSVDKRIWKGSSWGENATVKHGETAYYRVAVRNTGSSAGNIVITDRLQSNNTGGKLTIITFEDADCPTGATCTGSIAGGGISATGVGPGDYVVVDYQRIADNTGIAAGAMSTITDIASLNIGKTDTASVTIPGKAPPAVLQVEKTVSADNKTFGENITRTHRQSAYYKIVVRNVGSNTGSTTVTDLIDTTKNGSLSAAKNENIACASGASCTGSLTRSGINISNLTAGKSVTITYHRTADTDNMGEGTSEKITDTATLTGGDTDTASVLLQKVALVSNFTIDKRVFNGIDPDRFKDTAIFDSTKQRHSAYYKIIIKNTGSAPGDVTVTDALSHPTNGGSLEGVINENIQCDTDAFCSGGLAGAGIQITSLDPNKIVTIWYKRMLDISGVPNGGESSIIDTATLSTGVSDTAEVIVRGEVSKDFTVEKLVFDGIDPNGYGEEMTIDLTRAKQSGVYYRVIIKNVGNKVGSVTVTDSLAAPTSGGVLTGIQDERYASCHAYATCSGSLGGGGAQITNLPPGRQAVIIYKRIAKSDDMPSGGQSTIIDTAKLSTGASDTARVNILGPVAAPTCSNFISAPPEVDPDTPFALYWNSTNQQSFRIEDDQGNTVNANGIQTSYTVVGGINAITKYTLTIYSDLDQSGKSASCTSISVPINVPSFTISKFVSKNGTDFSKGPITLENGETAHYSVVLQNTGTFGGSVEILDELENGTNGGTLSLNGAPIVTPLDLNGNSNTGLCPDGDFFDPQNPLICTLQPNETATIVYKRTANSSGIPVGSDSTFNNTASIVTIGHEDSASVIVKGDPQQADLGVGITVDDDEVAPNTSGETTTLTYTVNWENLGNVDTSKTTITVSCDSEAVRNLASPTGTVSGSNVSFGPFQTSVSSGDSFTFTADLKDGFGEPVDQFDCDAHIEDADFLPISKKETNDTNNDDTVKVHVDSDNRDSLSKSVKNLRSGKSGTKIKAIEEDELLYTLTYTAGDTDMDDFEFTDDISGILKYADLIDEGGGTESGGMISWPKLNISAYDSESVSFTVQVFSDLSDYTGEVVLENEYGDTVLVTVPILTREKFVQVENGPRVKETKAKAGEVLTYTLTVTNSSSVNRPNYRFIDEDISAILKLSAIEDNGGGTINGARISWPPETILAGKTVEKSFKVRLNASFDSDEVLALRNTFGNETIVKIPNIVQSKIVRNLRTGDEGTSVNAETGDKLMYELTVKETGNQEAAEGYSFSDNITDILRHSDIGTISISDNGQIDDDPLNPTSKIITWPIVDIPPGGTVTRTYEITINPESDWPDDDDQLENWFGNQTNVLVGRIVTDTHIEKTASETELIPGMEVKYTLTFGNKGDRTATNTLLEDDFDEVKLDLKRDGNGVAILPPDCEEINKAGSAPGMTGINMVIQCTIGELPPNGPPRTINYDAIVRENSGGPVTNTATISQNEKDNDESNNTDTLTLPITEGELLLTKTVTPSSVSNGQSATYTVSVNNTNVTNETFSLQDVLSPGNNKGTLTFDKNSVSVTFNPQGSGTTAGTFADGGNVIITDLEPDATVTITYTRTGNNEDIDFNQSSLFTDTVSIVGTDKNAAANVFVLGPSRGGGGGGGGGGGRRTIRNAVNLHIQKEVKDERGKWHDANEFDLAVDIGSSKTEDVGYRITVRNEGNATGKNITIEDIFTSLSYKRTDMKDIEGAEWDNKNQLFTIASLRSGKSEIITYTATLKQLESFEKLSKAKNIATITGAEGSSLSASIIRSRKATVRGVGTQDSAHVKTEIPDKITLQKTVSKKVLKPGEEGNFNMIIHNRGKTDFNNLVVTDSFPFHFLDIVETNDLRGIDKAMETLTYTKRKLKAGDIWIIKLRVRVKETVPGNTKVRNSITIAADNADLSGLYAYAEVVVTPLPQPKILIRTGPLENSLALMLLGLIVLGFGYRQLRRKG